MRISFFIDQPSRTKVLARWSSRATSRLTIELATSRSSDDSTAPPIVGPIAGAFLVNGAKSWLTVVAPSVWLYFLGLLFVAVTLYMPGGLVGLVKKLTGGER